MNPAHLWLGTRAENNADRDAKGRTNRPIGETHPRAKLTYANVEVIRSLRYKVSQRELGERFGVSPSTIRDAQTGKNWSNELFKRRAA